MSTLYTLISFGFMLAAFISPGNQLISVVLSCTFFLASNIQDVKEMLK